MAYPATPAEASTGSGAAKRYRLDANWVAGVEAARADPTELAACATTLGNRLLAAEDASLALRGQIARLERALQQALDRAAGAAAFGNRLLSVEDATLALRGEISRLHYELEQPFGGAAGPVSVAATPLPVEDTGVASPGDIIARLQRELEQALGRAGGAAAFGNRLLSVEDTTLALRGKIARLEREREQVPGGGGSGGWFDVPRGRHFWPLAEDTARDEASLGPYERRVDDEVVLEGRRGEDFLARFGLLTPTPAFAAAVAALNATQRRLRLVAPGAAEAPDVSVIIPIYGQLGYTLNCLDSLVSHASRYSAEIVVVDDRSPDRSGEFLPAVEAVRYHRQRVNGGFIRSCNAGGDLARGRYVVMLNNDTRVAAGWLDALLDSFAMFPAAGLVGSKLCYPDGRLQEAGGIIWRDGSCWNYGRNDDPNRPHYAHARPVDYVSGCSIALPTRLWRELGGFDPLYAPAYCEDADLCLRLAAMGREVWFQPQSRVVHYEGRTSGTDISTGVKAHQVVNGRKLFLRWRETLELHRPNGEAAYFERERGVRRRMLVVDQTVPTPDQDAGSVQTGLGLLVCRDSGYKTHFVAGDNWLFQPGYTTELQKAGIECAYAPYDLNFASYIRRFGHLFDVVMVYRMDLLERVLGDIRAHAPQAALLFHVADLHFLRRRREAELGGGREELQNAAEIKRRELALVNAADCTITHSPVEAAILAEEAPAAPVAIWPMMVDFAGTQVPFSARKDICFLGGYRHPPNVDAARHFVKDMLPLLRAADPAIRFIIAGSHPSDEVLALAGDAVEVVGMVDDLRDLFDRARVFVCPLRFGAGVKGKIISALSFGIPIVSTSVGVEGAGLEDGTSVLIADTPADFVRQIVLLYHDESVWRRLSVNGQDLVRREFSTDMGRRVLGAAIRRAHAHRLDLDRLDLEGVESDGAATTQAGRASGNPPTRPIDPQARRRTRRTPRVLRQ